MIEIKRKKMFESLLVHKHYYIFFIYLIWFSFPYFRFNIKLLLKKRIKWTIKNKRTKGRQEHETVAGFALAPRAYKDGLLKKLSLKSNQTININMTIKFIRIRYLIIYLNININVKRYWIAPLLIRDLRFKFCIKFF